MGRSVKKEMSSYCPFLSRICLRPKERHALVVAELEGDDRILCQITSQQFKDNYAVLINDADFEEGSIKKNVINCSCDILLHQSKITKDHKADIYPDPERLSKGE